MADLSKLPPPPAGYSLDNLPPPPAGYAVEGAAPQAVPGNTPAERRAYLRSHPDAAQANRASIAQETGYGAPPEGSSTERFFKGLVSPITGAAHEVYTYLTDPAEWARERMQSTPGLTSAPFVPGEGQAGQAASGNVAGAIGSGVGQAATTAAIGKVIGPRRLDRGAPLPGEDLQSRLGRLNPEPPAPAQPEAVSQSSQSLPAPSKLVRVGAHLVPGGKAALRAYDAVREVVESNTPQPKALAVPELQRAVRRGAMSLDDYRSALVKQGHTPENADIMAGNLDAKIQAEAAKATVKPAPRGVKPPPIQGHNPPLPPDRPAVAPPPVQGSSLQRMTPPARPQAVPPPVQGSSLQRMAPPVEAPARAAAPPPLRSSGAGGRAIVPPPEAPSPQPPVPAANGKPPILSTPGQAPRPQIEEAYPTPAEARTEPVSGAAPKSHYESAARTVKARAIARALKQGGYELSDIQAFKPEDWASVAKQVGVNEPSPASVQRIIEEFPNIETQIPKKANGAVPEQQFAKGGVLRKAQLVKPPRLGTPGKPPMLKPPNPQKFIRHELHSIEWRERDRARV